MIPNIPFSTLGDIAAAGMGYAAGFVLGLFAFSGSTTPGELAGVFAVGCVGIKNFGQVLQSSLLEPYKERRRIEKLYQEAAKDFTKLMSSEQDALKKIEEASAEAVIINFEETKKPLKEVLLVNQSTLQTENNRHKQLYKLWKLGRISNEELQEELFTFVRSAPYYLDETQTLVDKVLQSREGL